jgi:hypothetical protein
MHWFVRVWLKNQIHYAGAYSLKPLSKSLVVRAKHSFSRYMIAGARRTVALSMADEGQKPN